MTWRWAGSLLLVAVLLVVVGRFLLPDDARERSPLDGDPSPSRGGVTDLVPSVPVPDEEADAAVREPPAANAERVDPEAKPWDPKPIEPTEVVLEGRVFDRTGTPAGDVLVLLGKGRYLQELGRTDADGGFRFRVRLVAAPINLRLEEPWVFSPPVPVEAGGWEGPRELQAHRRGTLEGRVVDAEGRPVDGVSIEVLMRGRYFGNPAPRVQYTRADVPAGGSNRFTAERLPILPGTVLRLQSIRFERTELPIDLDREPLVELRLPFRLDHVTGRVLSDGRAPRDGRLRLGRARGNVMSSTGEFAVDLEGVTVLDRPLVVAAQGHAPVVIEGVGRRFLELGRRHPPIEVALEPAGRISGRVLGPDGAPASGVWVSITDPAEFYDEYAEAVASPQGVLTVESEADGSFLLDGLRRQEVTVVALDPETLLYVRETLTPDREELILRLPSIPTDRVVRGRILAPDGESLGAISVTVFAEVPGRPHRDRRAYRRGQADLEGYFEVAGLPDLDLKITAGHDVHPRELALPRGVHTVNHEFQRLCVIEIEWPPATPGPDAVRVWDGLGQEVPAFRHQWGVYLEEERLNLGAMKLKGNELQVGRVWVPEGAQRLGLYRNGIEILQLPLSPHPNRKQTVRP